MAENTKVVRYEYYPEGVFTNDEYLECKTGLTQETPDGKVRHAVSFYMKLPKDDAECRERYNIGLDDLIRLGVRQLGYNVRSEDHLKADNVLGADGKLKQEIVNAIQADADTYRIEKRQAAPRKTTIEKAKQQVASDAGFTSYDEMMKALEKIKKAKK